MTRREVNDPSTRHGLLLLCIDHDTSLVDDDTGMSRRFVGHFLGGHHRGNQEHRDASPPDEVEDINLCTVGGVLRIPLKDLDDPSTGQLLYSDVDEGQNDQEVESSIHSENKTCQVRFRNEYSGSFLVCWCDETGKLHHYYPVNDGSIQDGSVTNVHTEFTRIGHAFVVISTDDPEEFSDDAINSLPGHMIDIKNERLLCYYKPLIPTYRHEVTIRTKRLRSFSRKTSANVSVKLIKVSNSSGSSNTLIDTSKKQYMRTVIAGFTCMYENSVFDETSGLRPTLEEDLDMIKRLLPYDSYQKLIKSTKFWINKSITFGTVGEPVVGRGTLYLVRINYISIVPFCFSYLLDDVSVPRNLDINLSLLLLILC